MDSAYTYWTIEGPATRLVTTMFQAFTPILGLSAVASLASASSIFDIRLVLLGILVEIGRRVSQWAIERFQIRLYVSAHFDEGDQAYDWVLLFLTEQRVWRSSQEFKVMAKTSMRRWGINSLEDPTAGPKINDHAEYIPVDQVLQLFRWNGYWVEAIKSSAVSFSTTRGRSSTVTLKVYTRNMDVLAKLVEAARLRYTEHSKSKVSIHTPLASLKFSSSSPAHWSNVKRQARRSLNSLILEDGVLERLLKDVREFLSMEEWYCKACIPYRRGYLLYGPPGTGKTSTIYALASELQMEIYSLSLASSHVDDTYLQTVANAIPKNSIFLIEDIDCAFPKRDDDDDSVAVPLGGMFLPKPQRVSAVTLSALLNVLDGVGSEEGKLFFATTNFVERLDSALIRPGRIDMKVEYKLATKAQAAALFIRFYPSDCGAQIDSVTEKGAFDERIRQYSQSFADQVPQHEFSTAELQGYLLNYKREPALASKEIGAWVTRELKAREEATKAARARKEGAKNALSLMMPGFGHHVTTTPPAIGDDW